MNNQLSSTRQMHIGAPRIEQHGERVRLIADIDLGNGDVRPLWAEVDACYGQYLCAERSDAFLVGLLHYAMSNRYDVVCEAPVTAEILLRLRTVLIPILVHNNQEMHTTQIDAPPPVSTDPLPSAKAVGTGLSCGVDSLHAIKSQLSSPIPGFSLTHLCNFDVGAFWRIDRPDPSAASARQAQWARNHAKSCAEALGLPLLMLDSNLMAAFPQNFGVVYVYSNLFAILALQHLWGAYFMASAGHGMTGFPSTNAEQIYELLLLDCCSTPTLRLCVEAAALTRVEKIRDLAEWPLAQQYLHVCYLCVGPNCGYCIKCLRTLIILDALGKLDAFGQAFDVAAYRAHRKRNLRWCYEQTFIDGGDDMTAEAYALLKKEIPIWVRLCTRIRFLIRPLYHVFFRNKILHRPVLAFERWRRRLIGDYSLEEKTR